MELQFWSARWHIKEMLRILSSVLNRLRPERSDGLRRRPAEMEVDADRSSGAFIWRLWVPSYLLPQCAPILEGERFFEAPESAAQFMFQKKRGDVFEVKFFIYWKLYISHMLIYIAFLRWVSGKQIKLKWNARPADHICFHIKVSISFSIDRNLLLYLWFCFSLSARTRVLTYIDNV